MDHVGIDAHVKYSEICVLSEEGIVRKRKQVPTTEAALRRFFRKRPRARLIVECGPMTPWLYRLLCSFGHEVVVVNPRRVRLIAESSLKNDQSDAEMLARLSRSDSVLLGSVYQRSRSAQLLRSRLRTRTELVQVRTKLINSVRGVLRAHGYRMPRCATDRFAGKFVDLEIDDALRQVLDPMLEMICQVCEHIAGLTQELEALSDDDELMVRLRGVPGVGPLVSVAFVAWMDRPDRFSRSRNVGAALGLRPWMRGSGGKVQYGRITREGDTEMRRLLVQAAHVALRSRKETHLKKWATALAQRAGKKKAIVALARKIAIVLHRLWVTGQDFQPLPAKA